MVVFKFKKKSVKMEDNNMVTRFITNWHIFWILHEMARAMCMLSVHLSCWAWLMLWFLSFCLVIHITHARVIFVCASLFKGVDWHFIMTFIYEHIKCAFKALGLIHLGVHLELLLLLLKMVPNGPKHFLRCLTIS